MASVPLATTALALEPVDGGISGDPVAPGVEATLSFELAPTVEGETLDSFTLTPPANWQLVSGEGSPSNTDNYTIDGNALVGSNLDATIGSPATVSFRVMTGCKQGNWDWTLDARDAESTQFGNGDTDLTTNVNASCTLDITTDPTDAEKSTLITGTAFNSSTNFVEVTLKNGSDQTVTYFPVDVTFDLATGTGLATGTLSAATIATDDGVATFSGPPGTLSISTPNDPALAYKLKPKTAGTYAGLGGADSDPFDIWEDGCRGTGCQIEIRNGNEDYTAGSNVGLGASVVPAGPISEEISCPTQRLIFSSSIFFHVTTDEQGDDTVFLETHILRADMKAAANNGQKLVGWCIGLKSSAPWVHNGASFTQQEIDGQIWYVAMAPKCPNKKTPAAFAPCVVSQMGDNDGGSFIRGYVLGGDPPRRT